MSDSGNHGHDIRIYPQALLFFAFAVFLPFLISCVLAIREGAGGGVAGLLAAVAILAVLGVFAWSRGALAGE